ncbi:glycosyltransferase [Winogradskyella helgolandensis]|uniref:glycosyltransferase n=1 Tax=Winogradskyella helgolandensis TaxID=2697010 RepID=UPI0015BFDB29|nr:hypothetical protein [Winogradskyella helgolandensis]
MNNKIIWFLSGNPDIVASSRIHGRIVHEKLVELGYQSYLAYTPIHIQDYIPFTERLKKYLDNFLISGDIIIIQKIKEVTNVDFYKYLNTRNIKIYFVDCDLPVISPEYAAHFNKIITTSSSLKAKYLEYVNSVEYIIDSPEIYKDKDFKEPINTPLQAVWFGNSIGSKWLDVIRLKEIIVKNKLDKWEFITISNHPDADYQWSKTSLQLISKADAILIPIFTITEENKVKSSNRVLQSMALDVPVLCSSIESYEEVIDNYKNGIIVYNDIDWIKGLRFLEDIENRKTFIKNGKETALKYSMNLIIDEWITILNLDNKFEYNDSKKLKQNTTELNSIYYYELFKTNHAYSRFFMKNSRFSNGLKFKVISLKYFYSLLRYLKLSN